MDDPNPPELTYDELEWLVQYHKFGIEYLAEKLAEYGDKQLYDKVRDWLIESVEAFDKRFPEPD